MRGLTLWQPWASLIAVGAKRYETRSWATNYRGPLAIHAAARKAERLEIASHYVDPPLPLSAIVAVGTLVDVIRTERLHPGQLELRLGDFTPGRWAWRLEGVRMLDEPLLCAGAQGLWALPRAVLEALSDREARATS